MVKWSGSVCGGVVVATILLGAVVRGVADDGPTITGTVWDLGDVLGNAQVYVWKYKAADGYHQIDHPRSYDEDMDLPTCTRTNEDGQFSLPWVEGATELHLTARNAGGDTRGLIVRANDQHPAKFVIRMGTAQPREEPAEAEGDEKVVSGLIWDNGAPCAGAQVFVMKYMDAEGSHSLVRPDTFEENPDSPYFTRTDENGLFSLPWKPDADGMRVHARNSEGVMLGKMLDEPRRSVLIVLRGGPPPPEPEPEPEPVKLRGQVLGGDQKPIARAFVGVWELIGPQQGPLPTAEDVNSIPEQYQAYSDENGMFEFTLPGGVRGVNLFLSNAEIGSVYANASAGRDEPQKVYLYIPPKPYVSGVVVDERDQPVPGALVRVYVGANLGKNHHEETDAEGKFHIEFDDSGQRIVLADKEGVGFYATSVGTGRRRGGIYPSHDMELVLRPPGFIAGVVSDEATGDPLPGVEVKVWPYYVVEAKADLRAPEKTMMMLAERRFDRVAVTDAQGSYRLQCDAGRGSVYLSKLGYRFTGSLRGGSIHIPSDAEGQADLTMRQLYGVFFVIDGGDRQLRPTDLNIAAQDGKSRTYNWVCPPGAAWHTCRFVDEPGVVLTVTPVNNANGMTCEPSQVTVGETPQTVTLRLR